MLKKLLDIKNYIMHVFFPPHPLPQTLTLLCQHAHQKSTIMLQPTHSTGEFLLLAEFHDHTLSHSSPFLRTHLMLELYTSNVLTITMIWLIKASIASIFCVFDVQKTFNSTSSCFQPHHSFTTPTTPTIHSKSMKEGHS